MSAVRVVAHAVVVERRSVPISKALRMMETILDF
jgi:hypothetical protein